VLDHLRLVGREPELARLRELLAGGSLRTLLLEGGPGIGKTALWEAGIGEAQATRRPPRRSRARVPARWASISSWRQRSRRIHSRPLAQ